MPGNNMTSIYSLPNELLVEIAHLVLGDNTLEGTLDLLSLAYSSYRLGKVCASVPRGPTQLSLATTGDVDRFIKLALTTHDKPSQPGHRLLGNTNSLVIKNVDLLQYLKSQTRMQTIFEACPTVDVISFVPPKTDMHYLPGNLKSLTEWADHWLKYKSDFASKPSSMKVQSTSWPVELTRTHPGNPDGLALCGQLHVQYKIAYDFTGYSYDDSWQPEAFQDPSQLRAFVEIFDNSRQDYLRAIYTHQVPRRGRTSFIIRGRTIEPIAAEQDSIVRRLRMALLWDEDIDFDIQLQNA
jgi:hypothetical protein